MYEYDGAETDTRKLGCRNWRADVQDRGRWRHLFEETKFPVAKQPDSLPRAEVKNERNYTSTPPTCCHGVDKNKVTFYSFT
jgi:nitrate reductase cytochrome c-type subunit